MLAAALFMEGRALGSVNGEESGNVFMRVRFHAEGMEEDILQRMLSLPAEWRYNPRDGYYYFNRQADAQEMLTVLDSVSAQTEKMGQAGAAITAEADAVPAADAAPCFDADCHLIGWEYEKER